MSFTILTEVTFNSPKKDSISSSKMLWLRFPKKAVNGGAVGSGTTGRSRVSAPKGRPTSAEPSNLPPNSSRAAAVRPVREGRRLMKI